MYDVFWWSSLAFVCLFMLWLMLNVWHMFAMLRFMFSIPWMTWMTLEDACRHSGKGEMYCRAFLSSLNDSGYLETRVRTGLEYTDERLAHKYGLRSYNIEHFEFRLVPKGGRPKRIRFRLTQLTGIPARA